MSMKQRRLKKPVKYALIGLGCLLLVEIAAIFILRNRPKNEGRNKEKRIVMADYANIHCHVPVGDDLKYQLSDEKTIETQKNVENNLAINKDIKGMLVFQSGLLEQPVLQNKSDTNYYLYKDWTDHSYRSWGSISMDQENIFPYDEQNTTIYGHYVYPERTPDRTVMFTPLEKLMKQENYEDNKYVAFVLEDEVRYYLITNVLNIALVNHDYMPSDMQYSLSEFEPEYFQTYMARVNDRQYYETGEDLAYQDHILTLQTCIQHQPDNREIVLCKELKRVSFQQIKNRYQAWMNAKESCERILNGLQNIWSQL